VIPPARRGNGALARARTTRTRGTVARGPAEAAGKADSVTVVHGPATGVPGRRPLL